MQDSINPKRPPRSWRASLIAAMLVSGAVLTGCGGSSPSPAGATAGGAYGSASTAAGGAVSNTSGAYGSGPLAFSKCMRANGVPQFPDLTGNGMRIGAQGQTVSVNGVSLNAPAFAAARHKCQQYIPHTSGSPAQTAQQIRQGLQFARCMRSHGVPNFPDAQFRRGVDGNQEAYLPGLNLAAPAVQSAAKACGGGPKGP